MEDRLISIITPSFNSSRFISNTILSVLGQTDPDWEMLIVDDCSQDDSVLRISRFAEKDDRIRLIPLKKNVGAAAARNIALEQARGRYIAFLDSDDVWEKSKLEKQRRFMEENSYAFVCSSYYVMTEEGSKNGQVIKVPSVISYRRYLKNTIIGCLTVMIDKKQTGDFRMPLIKSSHDMALWLLIMQRGFKVYGMKEVLAGYRLVSTSNTAKKWKAAKDVWKVYREIEKLSVGYSAYCFCFYVLNAVLKRLK